MKKRFHQCNAYEQYIGDAIVFISYWTPQAVMVDGDIYQCTAKYSRTTSKQITRWKRETAHSTLYTVSAPEFEAMLKGLDYKGNMGYLSERARRDTIWW